MNTKIIERRRFLLVAVMLLAVVAMVGLAGCGGSSSSDDTASAAADQATSESAANVDTSAYDDLEPVTLILADETSLGDAGNLWGEAFVKDIEENTGGKITIDYYPNGEIGSNTDLLSQIQSNSIQMVITAPTNGVSVVKKLAVFDLAQAFNGYTGEQIDSVINGDNEFTQDLEAAFEDVGLRNLGFLQNATYRQVTSNKELRTLDDYKGFQIRTVDNPNIMEFWQAVGAEPTPLTFSEVYFSLQNGTVEGQENSTETSVGASLQEVQKYLCKTSNILFSYFMTINDDAWNDLDPAYQAAIEEAVAQATAEVQPGMTATDQENEQIMVDAGMEVIEYDDQFFEDLMALDGVKQLYSDISDQTDGLSDTMVELLEKA